jgi:UDP-2,4-diacetamido-2,4,6-trideoxy-beta-L-altropyranose hydrolase
MKPLVVRVDANSRMGLGHAMRCLALAQAWQAAGGRALFLMAEATNELKRRVSAEGMEVLDVPVAPGERGDALWAAELYRREGAELLALDGYHFDAAYQRQLKALGVRLLAFDDYGHAAHYAADIVLNQTNAAQEELYARREPSTRLLLGTNYVLLRREFWPWIGRPRIYAESARKVLVTLGGADSENATAKVLAGLAVLRHPDMELTVILGAANRHAAQIRDSFRQLELQGRVLVDVDDMPHWMQWADLAITAGGSTVWELALFQLPCVTVVLAENQRTCLELLHQEGAILNLGWQHEVTGRRVADAVGPLLADRGRREHFGQRLGQHIDGRGAERVLHAVSGLRLDLSTGARAA